MIFTMALAYLAHRRLAEAFSPLPTGRAVVPPVAKDDAALSSHLENVTGLPSDHIRPLMRDTNGKPGRSNFEVSTLGNGENNSCAT